MTFHLTHTGPYAGMTICGATEHTPSDQHPSYSEAGLARQLANCCPDCAHMWQHAGEACEYCGHEYHMTECWTEACSCVVSA